MSMTSGSKSHRTRISRIGRGFVARVLLAGHYSYRSCGCLLFTLSSLIATSSLVEIFVPTRIEKPAALLKGMFAAQPHGRCARLPAENTK
jgi:hypothetical protein